MSRSIVIDWIYDLPVQTLTDELREDIIEMIEKHTQDKETN